MELFVLLVATVVINVARHLTALNVCLSFLSLRPSRVLSVLLHFWAVIDVHL